MDAGQWGSLDPAMPTDGRWGTPDPKPRGPGRSDLRQQHVEAGDYGAVLAELDRPGIDPADHERLWAAVHAALRNRARDAPGDFGLEQLDGMTSFLAFLRLRTETSLRHRLEARDRAAATHGLGPDPAAEELALDRLLMLYERQVRLIEARAVVQRRLALAHRLAPASGHDADDAAVGGGGGDVADKGGVVPAVEPLTRRRRRAG